VKMENMVVSNDMGDEVVSGINLSLYSNQILGLAGISGNGQQQLIEAFLNLRSKIDGKIQIRGVDTANKSIREIRDSGIAYIPEDRRKAMIPGMSIRENLILNTYKDSSGLFIDNQDVVKNTEELMAKYSIKAPSSLSLVSSLSGGNKQKVVVARELSREHIDGGLIIIAENPTIGLDVQTTQFVREQLLKKRDEGAGILLVSSDLGEILSLSDTIAVIYNGKIIGTISGKEATSNSVGLMMGGITTRKISNEEAR
ncbi:MAG: ATP-binding cassette domain-containing protein, partial [Candidatus Heimdallarchaeota archaeon]